MSQDHEDDFDPHYYRALGDLLADLKRSQADLCEQVGFLLDSCQSWGDQKGVSKGPKDLSDVTEAVFYNWRMDLEFIHGWLSKYSYDIGAQLEIMIAKCRDFGSAAELSEESVEDGDLLGSAFSQWLWSLKTIMRRYSDVAALKAEIDTFVDSSTGEAS